MKIYFMLSRNGFVAVVCAVILLFMLCGQFKTALRPAPQDGATNEGRVNYILSLGYAVDETPVKQKETVIPMQYGEEYGKYLSLQTEAGFPLEEYKGQSAVVYEYVDEQQRMITIIVSKNKIVGGHIISNENNELIPLKKGNLNGNNQD